MVHRLKIAKHVDSCGNLVFTLLHCNSLSDGKNCKQKYTDHYMDSCTFSAGSCFNVGKQIQETEKKNEFFISKQIWYVSFYAIQTTQNNICYGFLSASRNHINLILKKFTSLYKHFVHALD